MRDKFGTFRGKCLEGCACIEFKANPDGRSVRCSECNHAPIKHESFGVIGNCRGCTECKMFEASYGEFEFCEYCECALRQHCIQPKPAVTIGGVVQKDAISISPIYTQQQQQQIPLQTGPADAQYQFAATPQTQLTNPFTHPNSNTSISQMGPVPMNQMAPVPMNQMGPVPMNQMGPVPMNQMGQVPMNQMGPVPMNQMGPVPMNQMGPVPMNQMGQVPMNQMGPVPMNQMGPVLMNQIGQVLMNQPGAAQFNPMVPNGCMGQNQMGANPFLQQPNIPQPQQVPNRDYIISEFIYNFLSDNAATKPDEVCHPGVRPSSFL